MKECENNDQGIVIASALLHHIDIKVLEQIHGYNNGLTQEKYGHGS